MININHENRGRQDSVRAKKGGGFSVTDRLKSVASYRRADVTAVESSDGATAAIADHLPQTRVSRLDPKCLKRQTEDLENFKRDYENLQSTRINLPILRLISPRTKKLISQLPNPNPAELLAVERIQEQLAHRFNSNLYSRMAQMSDSVNDESLHSDVPNSQARNRILADSFNIRFSSNLPTAEIPSREGTPSTLFLGRLERKKQRERDFLQHQPNADIAKVRAATAVSKVKINESIISGTSSLQPLRQFSRTAFHAYGDKLIDPSPSLSSFNVTNPVHSKCINTSRSHAHGKVAALRSVEKPISNTEIFKNDGLINRLESNTMLIQEEHARADSYDTISNDIASVRKSIVKRSDDTTKATYNCGMEVSTLGHHSHSDAESEEYSVIPADGLSLVTAGTGTQCRLDDGSGLRHRDKDEIVNKMHSQKSTVAPCTVNTINSLRFMTSVNSTDEGAISEQCHLPDNLPVLSNSTYTEYKSNFELYVYNLKIRREKDTFVVKERQRSKGIIQQIEVEKQGDEHEAYLSQLCIGVERDLGIVLDKKYGLIKARKRSIMIILYYVCRMRERAVFSHWRTQTEESCHGRRHNATLLICQTFRAWSIRTYTRKRKESEALRARELSEKNEKLCTDARQKVIAIISLPLSTYSVLYQTVYIIIFIQYFHSFQFH